MKIGIDFDDTIVETKEKVQEFLNKYNLKQFNSFEEKEEFYKKHIDNMTPTLTLKQNVKEILNKLSNNELYIITARNNYYSNNNQNLVLKYMKDNELPIKEVCFDCYKEGKAIKCKELGIDLFIDDFIDNCLEVEKLGIKSLLFQNEFDGLTTVNSWNDILEYVEEGYGRKDNN